MPPGISENPNSAFFDNQVSLWAEGELHPAPLSREIIKAEATSTISLSYPPTPTPTPTDSPLPTPTGSPLPLPTESPLPTPTDSPLPTPTGSPLPTTELHSYIIVGVVLTLAAIAFVGILLLRKK